MGTSSVPLVSGLEEVATLHTVSHSLGALSVHTGNPHPDGKVSILSPHHSSSGSSERETQRTSNVTSKEILRLQLPDTTYYNTSLIKKILCKAAQKKNGRNPEYIICTFSLLSKMWVLVQPKLL